MKKIPQEPELGKKISSQILVKTNRTLAKYCENPEDFTKREVDKLKINLHKSALALRSVRGPDMK